MNFAAVKQANGQSVTMFGTFNEIGGVSFTQNQKPVCKCQIIDDAGEKHLVRLYNQDAPMPTLVNMRQEFSLKSYQGQYQGQPYTGYSGFWNDRAQVNQAAPQTAPQASYNAPQNPQQPAQRTNVPQPAPQRPNTPQRKEEPDWDAIAKGKVRHGIVCAGIQFGSIICKSIPDVDFWTEYVMTGKEPMVEAEEPQDQSNPNWVGENPPATDDNVPF